MMADNEKKKKVVLRLDFSRTERAFEEEESLWENELKRMFKLVEDHIKSLDASENKRNIRELPLLSIAIFGSPGSGKSSLLKTFERRANNKEAEEVPGGIRSNICSLPVIKPNFQSEDDHFLYSFLATALEADRKNRGDKEKQFGGSSILSPVQQKFQEVSEYLQVINNPEQSQEDDPMGVSMERLERHESGLLLNEKLGDFIAELANTLAAREKTSLVLMPVDDADLSLKTLVSALDTCWRYLQHPRLVPVFTFTGRLAEELLISHFEDKLTTQGIKIPREKLQEASTSLLMTENMAIQYLGRLFPVRNRIRLGQASGRVLTAYFEHTKNSQKKKGNEKGEHMVLELLKSVSNFLFGSSLPPIVPDIRAPLRMLILRRQLQIVDAMHSSGIEAFIKDEESEKEGKKSWGQAFDLAAWTLLNTHRDILKEINMNLDDLYSWTPQGLRRVVLNSVLNLRPEIRRRLLKHWLYRSEGRRSQMLSLLAANVFRPRMFGEELTGDDSDIIALTAGSSEKTNDKRSFPPDKGILWFLELCIGFYLPQILAANKPEGSAKTGVTGKSNGNGQKNTPPGSIQDVGWGLMSGTVNAVRGAVKNEKTFSTGMLFLNPEELSTKLKEKKTKANLLLHTWCFYGYEEDRPWGAVSLWRGLGLLGRLLRLGIDYRESTEDKTELIKELLKKHIQAALVVRHLPKGKNDKKKWKNITFKKCEVSNSFEDLPDVLLKWLDKFSYNGEWNRIFPIGSKKGTEVKPDWKKCFVRRMHGESIMSTFFQNLDKAYFEEVTEESLTAKIVLERWCNVLGDYWEGCMGNSNNIKRLLLSCPLLSPFLDQKTLKSLEIHKEDRSIWSEDEVKSFDIPAEVITNPSEV